MNIDINMQSYEVLNEELQKTKNLLDKYKKEYEQNMLHTSNLTIQIQRLQQELNELFHKYQMLEESNKILIDKLNQRFDTHEKRVEAIIEIALAERENLFNDVNSLFKNTDRFSLDNLLNYSPEDWLRKQNEVIVKFIETLTQNEYYNDDSNQKKALKRAIAVDAIYGSQYNKYVSEISLLASSIKYSLAHSKKVINIDNHITSGGSYSRFLRWLDDLSKDQEPLPKGLLFLAFDNEQKGQKNYLDRGFNTVIYHIVTSFVAFNMDSKNELQHECDPWLHKSLTQLQYEELFDITPQMQQKFDNELHLYLNEIINKLNEEKLQPTNNIDNLIENISNVGSSKYCLNCNERNIENRKKTCPKCHSSLSTLAELQKQIGQPTIEEKNSSGKLTKKVIFKQYNPENEPKIVSSPRISYTQSLIPDQNVHIPDIYIPDPLSINPNSIVNVEKILQHIENVSGVKDGIRKWIAVTCDGIPYHHAYKIKEKFPWLILIPGQLHEEMNMLRAYVELNWYL